MTQTIGNPEALTASVSSIMSRPVFTISQDALLEEARRRLNLHRITCLAAVQGTNDVEGVISLTDLLRVGEMNDATKTLVLPGRPVSDLMTRNVITVTPNSTVLEAAGKMIDNHIHRVFVLAGTRPVGVVSTSNLAQAIADARLAQPASAYATHPVLCLAAVTPLSDAVTQLRNSGVSGAVIVGAKEWPIGIFTQREAAAASHLAGTTPVEQVMSARLLTLDGNTAMHYAAAQLSVNRVRRVVTLEDGNVAGLLSGLDFARAIVSAVEHEG